MYASLTLLIRRMKSPSSYLLTVAVAALAFALTSCGSGEEVSEPVVQIADTATPVPTATAAPTSTPAPTATMAPPPTETPYWAKKIIPGIAMEQYPPLNDRTDYELRNTQEWLNGDPTTIEELRESGRIVLVDFWTYT